MAISETAVSIKTAEIMRLSRYLKLNYTKMRYANLYNWIILITFAHAKYIIR